MNMVYPDNEQVNYHYNSAGDLYAMTGSKWSSAVGVENFRYIDSINYNKYGQKTEIYYGNGTRAIYQYDDLQRLQFLNSHTSDNETMQSIGYTYDPVSNITFIANSAAPLSNGLGSNYYNSYQYDDLYRLSYANNTGTSASCALSMSYSPNGKIVQKSRYENNSYGYQRDYYYQNNCNKLDYINIDGSYSVGFRWDTNGNMISNINSRHHWDEENRMMMFSNGSQFGYYMYDASGERTYKLNGNIASYNMNGQLNYYPVPTMATLYVSPYLVASSQNYTKHYYAGTERVASKIGGGGIADITTPIVDITQKRDSWQQPYSNLWSSCLNLAAPCSTFFYSLLNAQTATSPETALYFYHSDHLGSASWITDSSGRAIQHLQYLPFGETWVDQRITSTSWSTRYSFSAKEKDEESRYSYFGARYYDSELSIWLSVDPMSDKYPYQSPYLYCGNNPLKIIDPNGEDEWEFDETGKCLNKDNKPITNTEKDIIRIKKADGTSVEKSYEYGTIKQEFTATVTQDDKNKVDVPFLKISGDDNAKSAFEFVADNTNAEWSLTNIGTESKGQSFLSSSGEYGTENTFNTIVNRGYTIRGHTHNHPSGSLNPSEKDCSSAAILRNKFGSIPMNIYSKGSYQRYNETTYDVNQILKKETPTLLKSWRY